MTHMWVNRSAYRRNYFTTKFSTLRITGPCYRGVGMCIAWFWDLQTTSFQIPWVLGQCFSSAWESLLNLMSRVPTPGKKIPPKRNIIKNRLQNPRMESKKNMRTQFISQFYQLYQHHEVVTNLPKISTRTFTKPISTSLQMAHYSPYMEVSKNSGTPKWMVCNGKPN